MKRLFTLFTAIAFTAISSQAAKWVDITSSFIKNPSFVGNAYTGWEGTAWGYANPKENAEHYQRGFNSYQTLKGLPAGKVRLSCKGFYRSGTSAEDYAHYNSGNAAEYQYAKLYVISSGVTTTSDIALEASGCSTRNLGGGVATVGQGGWNSPTYYIPNNMEAADYWFQAGYYDNSVECQVGSNGELIIGVMKEYTVMSDWACFDDFKLEWYGDEVKATAVQLAATSKELMLGETYKITANVLPANTTLKALTYTSSNTNVVSVDGNGIVTAEGTGTATISVKCGTITSKLTVTVKRDDIAAGSIIINEIMCANGGSVRDASTNFGSWVELYNPTNKSVSLGGLYVSKDPNNLMQHRLINTYGIIPAKGFALLNFEHFEVWTERSYRQIDGKLSAEGGTIIISDGVNILAQEDYPAGVTRTSYARTTDGGNTWATTDYPTPGASNATAKSYVADATQRLEAPVVNLPGQLFTGTLQVKVTIPAGATLRYTTDGTLPTESNGMTSTTGSFNVNGTVCYRFRLYQAGKLSSPVVTRSYIYDEGNIVFPIISLVTDRKHIFDDDMSIFSYSEYGRSGNGQASKYNANMSWDRPTNFEYFPDGREAVLSQECDMSAAGGWSRAFTPHSFKLKGSKEYELKNTFDYQFFADKPFGKHKTLQIRNGGNDNAARFKDAAIQRVISSSGIYVDYQAWQPAHVFINGQHYAVLNIREPNNKDHGYSNYGISDDFIEQFEISPDSGYVQMKGTGEIFQRFYNLSKTASDESSYAEICNIVDMDEYVNYMALQFYLGGTDFPQNNVKGYINTAEGANGKYHFVLFDLDHAFNTNTPLSTFSSRQTYTFDKLYGYNYATKEDITNTRLTKENPFVTIFLNMLGNDTFKKKFADAFCIVAGSVFEPQRVSEIISEAASYTSQNGWVNPWGTANGIINSLSSARQVNLVNHVKDYLSLTNEKQLSLKSNIDNGRIIINDMEVPMGKFSGRMYGDVTIKAVAPANYTFAGWSKGVATDDAVTLLVNESQWRYYDKGSLDETNWKNSSYSTSSWNTGSAPLGYGKTENATNTLAANKTCYYFRRGLQIDDIEEYSDFKLNYIADDGFIVYVNGTEAARYNMPSGSVTYSTVASSYAVNNPDRGTLNLAKSLFTNGTNTIAVEVHNNNTSSSDIMWECSITANKAGKAGNNIFASTESEYRLPDTATSNDLTAIFVKKEKEALANPIVINEVGADNDVFTNDYFKKDDWVELYNTTDKDIDVAGMYLSDNSAKPKKFQIPTDMPSLHTIIPAGGFKVVWCSKRDILSTEIHTSFKLAKEEGLVMISQYDGDNIVFCDSLHYGLHGAEQSVGRYSDGDSKVYVMDKATPGKPNICTMYAEIYADETATDADIIETDDVNSARRDTRKFIEGTRLFIRHNGMKYNAAGQLLSD